MVIYSSSLSFFFATLRGGLVDNISTISAYQKSKNEGTLTPRQERCYLRVKEARRVVLF